MAQRYGFISISPNFSAVFLLKQRFYTFTSNYRNCLPGCEFSIHKCHRQTTQVPQIDIANSLFSTPEWLGFTSRMTCLLTRQPNKRHTRAISLLPKRYLYNAIYEYDTESTRTAAQERLSIHGQSLLSRFYGKTLSANLRYITKRINNSFLF